MTMQLRTGWVHVNQSAVEFRAVEGYDCLFRVGIIRHLDERKASGLARLPVGHEPEPVNSPMFFKDTSDVLLGSFRTEVAYEDIIHLLPPICAGSYFACSSHSTGCARTCEFLSRISAHLGSFLRLRKIPSVPSYDPFARNTSSPFWKVHKPWRPCIVVRPFWQSHPGRTVKVAGKQLGRSAHGGECQLQFSR